MTKRRSRGEGTIYRRRDGRWVGMYTVHTLDGVKRRCVYGRTKAEARVKLTEAIANRDKGLVFDAGNLSVGEYLDKWLEAIRNTTHVESHTAGSTRTALTRRNFEAFTYRR